MDDIGAIVVAESNIRSCIDNSDQEYRIILLSEPIAGQIELNLAIA